MRLENNMAVLSAFTTTWRIVSICTLAHVALPCGGRHISGEQAFVPAPAQAALAPSEVVLHAHSTLQADSGGPADVDARSLPSGSLPANCFRESDAYPKVFQSNYYTPTYYTPTYFTPADMAALPAEIQASNSAMALSCAASAGCWQSQGSLGAGWCDYMCGGKRRRLSQASAPGSAGDAQASIAAAPAPSPSGALLCPGNITPVNATEHTTLCECRGYKKAWKAGPQLTEHQKAVLRDCAAFNTDVKQRHNVTMVELGSCADVTIHLHNEKEGEDARPLPSGSLPANCFRESDAYPRVFQRTYYTPTYFTPADMAALPAEIQASNSEIALGCAASGGCWQSQGSLGAGWCDYLCGGNGRRLLQASAPSSADGAQASIAAAPAPSPSGALLCPGNITPVNAMEHTTLCECRGYKKAWKAGPQLTEHQKAVLRDCAAFNTDVKQRHNVTTVELGSCADVTIHLHDD